MRRLALPIALLAVLPLAAFAEPAPEHAALKQDRREIRQDRRERQDSVRDLKRLEALLVRFDTARAANDQAGLLAVDDAVLAVLGAERRETRSELARDRAVIARDRREPQRPDRQQFEGMRRRNLELAFAARRGEIASEYRRLRGHTAQPELDTKRKLIVELVWVANGEVHENARQTQQDRRELRRDQRP